MMNLLPLRQQQYQYRIKSFLGFFTITFSIFCCLGITAFIILLVQLNIFEHKEKNIASQINSQEIFFEDANAIREQTSFHEEKIFTISTHQMHAEKLLHFMEMLPSIMPPDIYLVNFSWYENTGIIYGQAISHDTVTELLDELKKNPFFNQVNLVKSGNRHEQDNLAPIYFVIEFKNAV